MSQATPAVRADFWTALVLLALGLLALHGGWTMDRLEIRRIHPASIPGLVPMMLGAALMLCAGLLLFQSIRKGGHRPGGVTADRDGLKRLGLCLCLTLAYPLLLIGQLPYWLATTLFVFAFITLLEWSAGRSPAGHLRAAATALLQAVLVGVITALVFEKFFLVRLP
jgi:putative tricarboxylic transport membrane protein